MFSCDFCKKRFFNKENLETHSKLLYGSCYQKYFQKDLRKYICDYCNQEFQNNNDLINHISICNTKIKEKS